MKKKAILSMILLFVCMLVHAQGGKVKGNVKDSMGEPVIGATVTEAGNPKNAAVTDFDGNFEINLSPKGRQVVISYVGMKTKTLNAVPGANLDVTLDEDATSLGEVEVVSVGYGQARRRDLTGSISSVGEKTLRHITSTNAASAITGRLAGVNVVTTQGSPDAEVKIRVRGGGSITQNNEPLYIVDGFQVSSISDIPPTDIESVDVLKDASSTAIYGAKGANGVILVTTKSGRAGKTEVSFNTSVGWSKFYNETEVLSPYEYVYFQRELDPSKNASFFDRYGRWEDIDLYKGRQGTDWQKKLFDRTGFKQSYNVNVNGGTKDFVYSISYTRDDEEYIMQTSNFKRDNLNIKLKKDLTGYLHLDFNAKMNHRVINGPSVSSGWKLRDCTLFAPIGTLTDLSIDDLGDTGDLSYENISNLQDPFYNIANEYKKQRNFTNSYNLGITWDITKWLSWRVEGTYGFSFARTDNLFLANTGTANQRSGFPVGQRNYWDGNNNTLRTMLNFRHDFGKHHVDAMAGAEAYHSETNNMRVESDYFPLDYSVDNMLAMWNNGTSEPTYTTISEPNRTQSYFGRANYVYDGRYYLTFTLRADGTNVFSPGNKWGVFPAFAAAWRISDEPFMESTRSWLDNLKLRLSHGVAGNARVGSYWRQTYGSVTSLNQLYYLDETAQSALRPTTVLRNENLTWETKHSTNVGLDFSVLSKRLDVAIDWYNDVTKNLIMSVQLPSNSGYSTQYQNLGQTTNRGIEFTVNANLVQTRDFYLDANFNISFNKNKVDKLYDTENDEMILSDGAGGFFIGNDDYRVFVGEEVGLMYGYVYDGMYSFDDFTFNNETKRWVLNEGVVDNRGVLANSGGYFGPGHIKLKDLSGEDGTPDGKIDANNDRRVIGHAQPKHTGGFGINMGWKGFDLTALFNWSYGNDILNMNKIDYNSYHGSQRYKNVTTAMSLENRFTTIDPETGLNIFYGEYANPELLREINQGKTMWNPLMNNSIITDWAVEDGSFLRLGTLTLGYSLPKAVLRHIGAKHLRIYGTATNLFCITNYSGQDPEVSTHTNNLVMGYDRSAYPKARTFVVGLNLTF
ncbi:MAG: TonB-dependent receptor [Prevotella sp.]|nr:TonB-dependent receptor [Prevotella sp.]